MNQTTQVAIEFSRVLRDWLTPAQMAVVIEENAKPQNAQYCESHSYCDANMAMHEALCTVLGREPITTGDGPVDGPDLALWNEAWDLAKRHRFDIQTLENQA